MTAAFIGNDLASDSYPISQAGTQAAAAKTHSQKTPSPESSAVLDQNFSKKRILERIAAMVLDDLHDPCPAQSRSAPLCRDACRRAPEPK
jgi:hypothetical protein